MSPEGIADVVADRLWHWGDVTTIGIAVFALLSVCGWQLLFAEGSGRGGE